MYGALAVLCRPGADSRRDEVSGTGRALELLGYRTVRITGDGRLDGGDVLRTGSQVYVGRGGRTNAEGVRQLRAALTPLGARVTAVPMTKALHLKSAVTALPDGTVIGWKPVVEDPSFFPRFLAMPEAPGAHVVDLGAGRLLMSAAAPRSAERIAELGYTPILVDISEFEKLEGCVTCLSVRLRQGPRPAEPQKWRWVPTFCGTHRHRCAESYSARKLIWWASRSIAASTSACFITQLTAQ